MHDLVVVGAGPQALTLCTYLLAGRTGPPPRIAVCDPAGWLGSWHERFAALAIDHLRSPAVHHPHPDPYALLAWAREHGRTSEPAGEPATPSTALFAGFCDHLVHAHGLADVLVREPVLAVRPGAGATAVELAGRTLHARRVVIATNPVRAVLPGWAGDPRLRHSGDVDLRTDPVAGERVLVVGGGLTAAQLALGAADRGAVVALVSRRELRVRALDTEAVWLGRALPAFHAEPDPAVRRARVLEARGGGSVPAGTLARLRRYDPSRLEIATGAVRSVTRVGDRWRATLDGRVLEVDRIWPATGGRYDVRRSPLLADLPYSGLTCVDGLPDLGPRLRWPGTDVHLMGGLAALSLGPAAGNLSGARMAAERLAPLLGGPPRPHLYPVPRGQHVSRSPRAGSRRAGRREHAPSPHGTRPPGADRADRG